MPEIAELLNLFKLLMYSRPCMSQLPLKARGIAWSVEYIRDNQEYIRAALQFYSLWLSTLWYSDLFDYQAYQNRTGATILEWISIIILRVLCIDWMDILKLQNYRAL